MLQGVWKQHLRPRAVVGYGFKIFLPSPPNYVTRSPGYVLQYITRLERKKHLKQLKVKVKEPVCSRDEIELIKEKLSQ